MAKLQLQQSLDLHDAATRMLIDAAERVGDGDWHRPLADGKWSPALILAHLNATYDTVIAELRGGGGMRVRTSWWQRWMLRLTVLPSILQGKGFPSGALAPRETRPGDAEDREPSLASFRRRANDLAEAARLAPKDRVLTHAYFGSAAVADGVLLCARHIEHHTKQLTREAR